MSVYSFQCPALKICFLFACNGLFGNWSWGERLSEGLERVQQRKKESQSGSISWLLNWVPEFDSAADFWGAIRKTLKTVHLRDEGAAFMYLLSSSFAGGPLCEVLAPPYTQIPSRQSHVGSRRCPTSVQQVRGARCWELSGHSTWSWLLKHWLEENLGQEEAR